LSVFFTCPSIANLLYFEAEQLNTTTVFSYELGNLLVKDATSDKKLIILCDNGVIRYTRKFCLQVVLPWLSVSDANAKHMHEGHHIKFPSRA
jgi:hypothetical protein